MELKTSFDFDFKAKSLNNHTAESTVYVSHIDYNGNVIACAGNGFVKLYDINNGKVDTYFGTGQKALSDMSFSNKHSNLLCTSSSINGVIAIYDIRANNKQNSRQKSKQICLLNCPNKQYTNFYSVTMDDNIIIGSGKKDIYIWDKRKINQNQNANSCCYTLQSYHFEDVTKVRFNTFNSNNTDKHLLSISEDTLINEYDLSKIQFENNDDDDVLINSYSCEKELWNFGLFYDHNNNDNQFIYVLTNDDSLIVHKLNGINNNQNNEDKQALLFTMDEDTKEIENNDIEETEICRFQPNTLNNMTLIECFYDYNNYKQLCLLSCNHQLSISFYIFLYNAFIYIYFEFI